MHFDSIILWLIRTLRKTTYSKPMVGLYTPNAGRHGFRRPAHADSGDEVLAVVAEVADMALAENAQYLLWFVHRSAPAPPGSRAYTGTGNGLAQPAMRFKTG